MKASPKRNLIVFVSLTYVLFWCFLGLTGLLISLHVPSYVQTVAKNFCAWTPTIVVLIMFRQLYPGMSFGECLKQNFSSRVGPSTFLILLVLQTAIVVLAVMAQWWTTGGTLNSISLISPSAVLITFVVTATSGPMGEELGWRGYLLKELSARYTLFVSALLVGIIWGFWHIPLWLLSGYTGTGLLLYAAYFLVSIVSTSCVITVFYSRQWNLFVPIWIHFLFNFALALVKMDLLTFLGWSSLGYTVLASILIVIERKRMFERRPISAEREAFDQTVAT